MRISSGVWSGEKELSAILRSIICKYHPKRTLTQSLQLSVKEISCGIQHTVIMYHVIFLHQHNSGGEQDRQCCFLHGVSTGICHHACPQVIYMVRRESSGLSPWRNQNWKHKERILTGVLLEKKLDNRSCEIISPTLVLDGARLA